MKDSLKKIKLTILLFWAALILYYSIRSVVPTKKVSGFSFQGADHALAYFIFALLLVFVLKDYQVKNLFLVTVSATFVYGFGMELIQLFLPWRNFSFFDSLLNLLGGFSVLILKPLQILGLVKT